jgi:endogenous inhibitor of DNA gyrase (YacG/DUF329 family)
MSASELTASELARALAARRKKERKNCAICGLQMVGTSRRQYCSTRCANRVYWDRHRAALNQKRRERYRRQKQGEQ